MTEANDVLHPTRDAAWRLEDTGYDALRESSRESRFAISNGLIGVRGGRAINRGGHSVVPPRTLVAGLFDTQGPEQPGPTLVQAPNWLAGQLVCEGAPLAHTPSDGSSYRRTLDLRRGLLLTECRLGRPGAPTVFVRGLRLASQSARAVGLQFFQLDIEDGGGAITLIASFEALADGLIPLQIEQDYGMWRTHASHKRLAMACAVSLRVDGEILAPEPQGAFAWAWHWQARPGQSAIFERIVAVARADTGAQTPGEDARSAVAAPCADRIAAHEAAWEIRHRNSDVTVEGDAAAQQALRFALYHLNSAANPDDPRVSIAARALTGADYRGHVF
jgi:trehalose/maltose hydrolase-like predicted phosphorylase